VPNRSHAAASLCGGALTFGSLAVVRAPSAFCVPRTRWARDLAFANALQSVGAPAWHKSEEVVLPGEHD
jgi:heat shock protein HslJ